jgi:hypothetical protein
MGEAELSKSSSLITIHSTIVIYGEAASQELAVKLAEDISACWNEPLATVSIKNDVYAIRFNIEALYNPDLDPEKVWYNDQPRLNFFRIEEFVVGDISFVDGVGCNTGYFKLANLLQTATTAAHEYGHTIGLDHPEVLDIRGQDCPGIMFPRGTICDPHFQYDPNAQPGKVGGTLNPGCRKVLPSDIEALKLHKLSFSQRGLATVGEFTSIYHEKHMPADFPQ